MEAKLKRIGDVAVIQVSGPLEILSTQILKKNCESQLRNEKIIFNLSQTAFVGSTGIQLFLETLRSFGQRETWDLPVVGAGSEFRRIIQNSEIPHVTFFEKESEALRHLLSGTVC